MSSTWRCRRRARTDLHRVNVRREFDYDEDDPMADVSSVDDRTHERSNGAGLLRVQTEIIDKVWREVENSSGFPRGHFIAKSALGRRDPATVRRRGP